MKILDFIFTTSIVVYSVYLGCFKDALTIKDATLIGILILMQVIINAGKLDSIEKKLNKL